MPLLRKFQSWPKQERAPQRPQTKLRGSASLPRSHTSTDPSYAREPTQARCPATKLRIGERKQPSPERTNCARRRTSLEQTTGTSRNRNKERTSPVDLFRPDPRISHCRRRRQSCTSLLWGCIHQFELLFPLVPDLGNNAGP